METGSTPAPQKMLGAKQLHPTTPQTPLSVSVSLSHFFPSLLSSPPFLDMLSPVCPFPSFQKPTNKSPASGPRPRTWTLPPQHGLQCPNPPSSEGKGSGKEIQRGRHRKCRLVLPKASSPNRPHPVPWSPPSPSLRSCPTKRPCCGPEPRLDFPRPEE